MCWNDGVLQIDIESDSLILIQVLRSQMEVPWSIVYEIRAIKKLLNAMDYRLSQTYRESNKRADFLASWGCSNKQFCVFDSFGSMPKILKLRSM